MTILRAEVRILADDGVLVTETVTKAWVRYHPGFGEASPKRGKKAEKPPWTQMELTEELST